MMDHIINNTVITDQTTIDHSVPKLDSIKNTHMRVRAAGYLISEASLRGWVRNGSIRRIAQGRKSLIYLSDVIDFLENYPSAN